MVFPVKKDLSHIFAEKATDQTRFLDKLKSAFSESTVGQILSVLKLLEVEIPKDRYGFMESTEGVMIMSNRYGLVLRIERTKNFNLPQSMQINDNPFILQPLASFEVKDAVIEICPACHTTDEYEHSDEVLKLLKKTGIHFWDEYNPGNVGLLPFKTERFPDGIPVVIDRLSVSRAESKTLAEIFEVLNDVDLMEDPQKTLYADLKFAIEHAWPEGQEKPNKERMRMFWSMCVNETRNGLLVPGWNEGRECSYKRRDACDAAAEYDAELARKFRSPTKKFVA